jgi:hypothetical protein
MLEILGSHDHTTHALSEHAVATSPDGRGRSPEGRGRSRSPGGAAAAAASRDHSPRPSSRHAPTIHHELYPDDDDNANSDPDRFDLLNAHPSRRTDPPLS